jgi:hypothetical protein
MRNISKQEKYAATTTAGMTEPTLDPAHVFYQCLHGACDSGLRILILTSSMARLTSWVICCNVRSCQTGKSNIDERKGGTERNSPILKIGEYFAGSVVFGSSAPASGLFGGAAPKSSSGNRQSGALGANVMGDGGPLKPESKSVDSESSETGP